jgi:tetratricopeptide (TPR) repeat protein
VVQPESKVNSLFETITLKARSNTKFDELEFARFKADANHLALYLERNEVLGFAHAIQGNKEEAITHYKNALSSSHADSATYRNYYLLLKKINHFSEAVEFGKNIVDKFPLPSLLNHLLLDSVICLDLASADKALDKLKKMNKLDNRSAVDEALLEMDLLMHFSGRFVDSEQLNQIGKVALNVAKKFDCDVFGNRIEHIKENNHVSIQYVIDADRYSSAFLYDLNWELFGSLIDADLDSCNAVVQFTRFSKEVHDSITISRMNENACN